ncbi:3-dehydroquinate synthase [Caldicellulosiruptoraceae bacterium PP1]
MEIINMLINQENQNVDIVFLNNFNEIEDIILNINFSKCLVVVDSNVYNFYKNLKFNFTYDQIIIESCEQNKSIEKYLEIIQFMIEKEYDRSSLIIGIGGGVIGDLIGFVASTYKRGIKFINIPTTLLAMVDSSIGGKTAVNFNYYKNQIGTFYQPDKILIYTQFLNSLSYSEIVSGFGEIIKYGYTLDKEILKILDKNKFDIKSIIMNESLIYELIKRSIICKKSIVEIDVNEKGQREVLNFGHTLGHAFESYYKYKYPHGINVLFGMIIELYISKMVFNFNQENIERLFAFLNYANIKFPNDYDEEQIIKIIMNDKKVKYGKIRTTLLKDLGVYENGVEIDKDIILKALKMI